MRKINILLALGALIFIFSLYFTLNVFAQSAQSDCVITKIGKPETTPVLLQGCKKTESGELLSPTLEPHPIYSGYFKLPVAEDESYETYSCANHQWGSRELINVLYSVAKRWKQKYPQGRLYIGDLNASGHASHKWGRAVDLEATTNGTDMVADFTLVFGPYNRNATAELGKMFADTNFVQNIWFNDQSVNYEVLDYANDPEHPNRSAGMIMQPIAGHDNHFHLDVRLDPFLTEWLPGC